MVVVIVIVSYQFLFTFIFIMVTLLANRLLLKVMEGKKGFSTESDVLFELL